MDAVDFGNAQSRAADTTSRVQQLLMRELKGCDHLGRRQEDRAEVYKHWQAVSKPNVELLFSHTQGGLRSSQWDLEEVALKQIKEHFSSCNRT